MSSNLKSILKQLGLKQAELAKLLDVTPRTVSQWATGETAIPGPVRGYLRVLGAMPTELRTQEFNRLEERHKMLDEGIYELFYKAPDTEQIPGESALCVLRNGKILGSDRWGGVFEGSYKYDAIRNTNSLHVRLKVPPEGELVTGFSAGPNGATIEVTTTLDRAAPLTQTTVDIADQPVELQMKFLGPLPN